MSTYNKTSFWTWLKSQSLLVKLIIINVAVFLALRLTWITVLLLFGAKHSTALMLVATDWLGVPSSWLLLARHAWTILTFQFTHFSLWHIFGNMIMLYWLGRIFLEVFNAKQLTALYLMGGFAGGLLFTAACSVLPSMAGSAPLIGASASVLAIVVAITVYSPNYRVSLFLLGGISLKWITAIMVLLLLLSFDGSNTGGLIAHLGGALMGLAWALSIRRGHDLTAWLNKTIDTIVSWFKGRKRPGVKHEYKENVDRKSDDSNCREARLDEILKKIKQSGYGALTDEEKEILFSFSRKK